ncbi:Fc.00g084950.m01.CDS01 [Cosmosporella sp. VM-42]
MENQSTNTASQGSTSQPKDQPLKIYGSPSTDWLQCAVSHFFHNFVLLSNNGFPGYFEFLPRLYGADPAPLYLRYTVEAIAMAHLARTKHMGDSYLRKARGAYGSALHRLGLALSDGSEATSPSGLATVGLLWKYDIIMGEDNLKSGNPHRQGQLEILRLRLSQKFESDIWINRSVLAGVQMQHIDPSTPPPNYLPTPSVSSRAPLAGPGFILQEGLLHQAASLAASISPLVQSGASIEDITYYTSSLQDLRQRFQTWEDGLPEIWRYKTLPNPLATEEDPFPSTVIILPGICSAGMWMACWLGRLSVLRNMMVLLPHGLKSGITMPPMSELRDEIISISICICSSIPYMLGHVTSEGATNDQTDAPAIGAFFATRSLHICAQMPVLPEEQVGWILDRMKYIGHEKGIRQALVLRDEVVQKRAAMTTMKS